MSNERALRLARQHLQTSQLLGVGFAVVTPGSRNGSPGDEPPQVNVAHGVAQHLFAADAGPPPGSAEDKAKALKELRERHDAECPHCTTATAHTRTVFGEGNAAAALMFIGEAPGADEDRTGRPFVGRAGQKLDEMIRAMGLERQDVYIANILKSRPPENRTPLPSEIDGCSPYLAEQIRVIRPAVLVALGGPAAKWMLNTRTGITKLRGVWARYTDANVSIPVMPTFHPAYLLRNYTPQTRGQIWSDLQAVMRQLGIARP